MSFDDDLYASHPDLYEQEVWGDTNLWGLGIEEPTRPPLSEGWDFPDPFEHHVILGDGIGRCMDCPYWKIEGSEEFLRVAARKHGYIDQSGTRIA